MDLFFFFFQELMVELEREEVLIQEKDEEGLERQGEPLSLCSHENSVVFYCWAFGLSLRKDTGKGGQNSTDKSRTE